MSDKIKVLSLFSGIGAFEKALTNLDIPFELVNFCDFDKYAVKSYCAIHDVKEDLNLGDVYNAEFTNHLDKIDLLTGGSPCFLKGELVNTKEGLKPIEDIEVGDYVKSHDGTYNKVIETMINKNNSIYDIKCSATHKLNTTNNHPFYIYRDNKFEWVESKDLTTSDFMVIPINKNQNNLESKLPIHDSRFWYLIGRFIGDGWVIKRKDRNNNVSGIRVCCGKSELEDFKSKIGDVLNYCTVEDRTTYKLQFSNKELGDFCSKFGVGAKNKRIPQEILDLKVEYLKPLLDGILESDGCFTKGYYKITSISKHLVYGVGELILKVHKVPYSIYKTLRPSTCTIEGRTVNQENTYEIKFKLSNHNNKINYVDDDYLYSRIRKIDCREDLNDVYNIEVENTHSYCVNNIATHNCQDFSVAGKNKGSTWTCLDCGVEYNPIEQHYSKRTSCVNCNSTNIEKTRSSLLVEYLRAIRECRPRYFIYENVKNIIGKKHKYVFDLFINELEEYGYKVWYEVLNAKHYGIPQNRERILVVGSLDHTLNYTFPPKKELRLRLKDLLEEDVPEKYYLSKEIQDRFKLTTSTDSNVVGTTKPDFRTIGQSDIVYNQEGVMGTLLARDYKQPKQILEVNRLGGVFDTEESKHQAGSVYDKEGLSPTIDTAQGGWRQPCIVEDKIISLGNTNPSNHNATRVLSTEGICCTVMENHGKGVQILEPPTIKIPQATKEGYIELEVPGIADLSYPNSTTRRGRVQERGQVSPCIAATQQNICYIEYNDTQVELPCACASRGRNPDNPSDRTTGSYLEQRLEINTSNTTNTISSVQKDNYIIEHNTVCETRTDEGIRFFKDNVCGTLRTIDSCGDKRILETTPTFRIRKLMPSECWALMGFTKEDIQKCIDVGISDTQLYKQAGNSIVVPILEGIIKNIFHREETHTHSPK